jgi:hypothetical protein
MKKFKEICWKPLMSDFPAVLRCLSHANKNSENHTECWKLLMSAWLGLAWLGLAWLGLVNNYT